MISQIALIACLAASAFAFEHGHHAPQPYKFGYSVKDKHGEQHREESGDGGHAVKGSYGFTDDRGIHRQVNYVADHAGFRAQVKTNEPGTANQNPAAVHIISDAPAHGHYLGGLGYAAAAPVAAAVPAAVGYGYNGAGYGYNGLGGYAGYGGLGYAAAAPVAAAVPAAVGYGYNGLGGYAGYGGLGYAGGLGYGGYGLGGAFSGLGYARYGF